MGDKCEWFSCDVDTGEVVAKTEINDDGSVNRYEYTVPDNIKEGHGDKSYESYEDFINDNPSFERDKNDEESIYRYCFNKEVSSKFDLFDSWVKTTPSKIAKRGEYQILDTIVCDKKKAILFSEEWWKNCLAFFLQKDKVNFLGYDFSSIIIETILKPFAYLVKEEISYEYEETIQTIKDTNDTEVLRLKKS